MNLRTKINGKYVIAEVWAKASDNMVVIKFLTVVVDIPADCIGLQDLQNLKCTIVEYQNGNDTRQLTLSHIKEPKNQKRISYAIIKLDKVK